MEQQIDLLKEKGLIINDEQQAFLFFERNNYYRLNIYFHRLMTAPDLFEGKTFTDVTRIYYHDRFLRNYLLRILEPIEIHIKTRLAYFLGRRYGPDCFYRHEIFIDMEKFSLQLRNFENERKRNKKDPVIRHHNKQYKGYFPIWVIVEYMTFNSASKTFTNLCIQDRKEIAYSTFGINEYYVGQWLHVLSVLRNICAHYGYLYKRVFTIRPALIKEFGWEKSNNSTLFAIFLIMKALSNKDEWRCYMKSLIEYLRLCSFLDLADYGFPDNWKSFLIY